MIKIENTEIFGWEAAIRGMRNPMNSWDKSDSVFCDTTYYIGNNDLKLMRNLVNAGNDHGKFARMINVTMDITAPLYWWKEFDTYKVGTVANSCSTMHKIHAKEFTLDDFSFDDFEGLDTGVTSLYVDEYGKCMNLSQIVMASCEELRKAFLKTGDVRYWRYLIQLLPSSYNQRRTVQLNYQVLWNMYNARKNHKLDEWRDFCIRIRELPYFNAIYLEG